MTSTEEGPRPRHAAAWIAAIAVALVVGSWITLPGVDAELLAEASGSIEGLFGLGAPSLPILGMSVAYLVGLRLALGAFGWGERRVARLIALGLYLLITAIQALAISFWAESVVLPFGELVHEPGWRFRIVATLTSTAGAAALWWLADRVDATRAATGALAVALVASLIALVGDGSSAARELAQGTIAPLGALAVLALPAALVVVAIGLAARTPARWPVRVAGKLELRSSFDALAAPAVIALLAGIGPLDVEALATGALLVAALTIAAGVGVIALLRARSTERGPRRALWPLAIALPSFALPAIPLALGLASSGALARMTEPGPLEGEGTYRLTLAAVDRFRAGEARAMVDRLNELGASAELLSADSRVISIGVTHAAAPEAITEALRPHRVSFHLVEDVDALAVPPGLRPPRSYAHAWEGECEAVRAAAPSAPCDAAIETIEDAEPGRASGECRLYCLAPAIVANADIADARVVTDTYSNQPVVTATLTDAAAERFARVTGESVDRQMAIVLDGEVVSAPVIRSAIPGGRVQITLGGFRSHDELLRQASLLVTTLRAGDAITSDWTLESVAWIGPSE